MQMEKLVKLNVLVKKSQKDFLKKFVKEHPETSQGDLIRSLLDYHIKKASK